MAYASGDIYGGGSFIIVGLLLLVYLTNVEGFSGTLAGSILFIGKAWDAITDPFMGQLSDRTRSRFGRRRIFFLLGSLPVFLSWVMLWYSFGITDTTVKFLYYTLAYIFFSTAFTIVMVPYNAILSDMVRDYNRRSAFTGMRLGFSAAAAIFCATVPALITGAYADPKQAYLVMGLAFFTNATPSYIVISTCSLIGVGSAGCNLFSWSALPDIADVDELITGRRREGLYSGASTFLRKLSGGLVVGVLGVALDVIGYSKVAVSAGNISPTTDWGIRILFCAIPFTFLIFALLFLRKYKLGRQEFIIMSTILNRYRAGETNISIEGEELRVCQQLTGLKDSRFFRIDQK